MNQQHAILHLSLIDGIGPITIQKIIHGLSQKAAWDELYYLQLHDWVSFGLKPSLAHHLYNQLHNKSLLDEELSLMHKHGIAFITIADSAYPECLRTIYAPPPLLYYQGTLKTTMQRHIAVVGSREANRYGKQIIEQLIPPLVAAHFIIVSGGAIGADSMVHRATIDAGGTTMVVLGSGLLKPYPYQHKKLFADVIATGGALVSIFPLATDPLPGNFPARNRVIAGVTDGVVVIQAAHKSGTRITAQFALEQGRNVYAVPGCFDDPLSSGCHALIKEGATLITKGEDILEDYGIYSQFSGINTLKASVSSGDNQLSLQETIVTLCKEPHSLDELAIKTEKDLAELQNILFEMHTNGVIEQDFMGLWKTT